MNDDTASQRARTTTRRVEQVRELMRAERLDALLVRSTDRYLNEYVPLAESTRAWLTGFSGSMGDALLALDDRAWLAVDGRYYLQADQEVAGTPFAVERVPLGTQLREAIFRLARRALDGRSGARLGYEPDRFSVKDVAELTSALQGADVTLVATTPSLVERARGPVEEPALAVRGVAAEAVGLSVAAKVERARAQLGAARVSAFVVQRLDELAYVTNLRGTDLPYQATFRGIGLLTPDHVVLAIDEGRVPACARDAALRLVPPGAWLSGLGPGARVGYDADGTTAAALQALRDAGAEPVAMQSPLADMKSHKTDAELRAMRAAFARADAVVEQAQDFVHERLARGERVTEADLAQEVERLFLASGAVGLSFKVIAAAGANGAVIHYSTPDPEREVRAGELVLLDTGAYYEEGYATDLTRTFLAGKPELVPRATAEQRRCFTLTLKSAIAGMSARVPEGARGDQLDAIARAPLWAAGLNFNHGTGHGVGINVHEFPPRVSPAAGAPKLEPGHVFSIEPGVYVAGFGGVRIENLCTVEPAPDAPGFLDVVPLTSSALDERLIDDDLLTDAERAWLRRFAELRAARLAGATS